MKKIRALALMLAAALLLTGCSALLERQYSVAEPHSEKYREPGDGSVLRAEDYQELVNDILTLVAAHTEESVIRLYMTDSTAMEAETLLEEACREVQEETAAGAYAVEYLTYTISETPAYREARLSIRYRRTAEQYASIVSVTSAGAIGDLLRGAVEAGKEELVLRTRYFTGTEEEIRTLLQELDESYNGPEAGGWTVTFYPGQGENRIIEFLLPQSGSE
ncbi:MAG: hypothetical protein ACI3W8_06815 [Oscillospiraceae bacterium]